MPVSIISTYAAFQSTLNDVSKVENDLTNAQGQLSSGNKSPDFAGLADQAQQYLTLGSTVSRTNQYLNDNQVVEARINTTTTILSQVISTATDLNNLIANRRTGIIDNGGFLTQVQAKWQALVSELNTSIGGRYLFSGTSVDTQAVDGTTFPTLNQPGVPDDDYYTGSNQDFTVQADDSTRITYNVRANMPGFQKIFAGLATAARGDASGLDADFAQAYGFVQDGLKDVIAMQATVNANKVQMSTIDQNHTTFKLYWQGLQQTIGNTDVVSVSTQVAVDQGILQAAFQAFAKISSLRLSDFLR